MLGRFRFDRRTRQVDAIVKEYRRSVARGEAIDASTVLAQYPELAEDLAKALAAAEATMVTRIHGSPGGPATDLRATSADADDDNDEVDNSDGSSLVGRAFGVYDVVAQIGRGAMGRVYRVRDRSTGEYHALKTLQNQAEVAASHFRRLGREASAQAKLSHPNIIRIIDSGEIEGLPYLVMELVENSRTLLSLMAEHGGRLDERQAAEIARDVTQALNYSHMLGVIHRDIKPSNILMVDETPKLTDFGLAFVRSDKQLTRLTRSGETLGTLCYMPPEQAMGRTDPEPNWDVYAVGATLYEMLTGDPPFADETPATIIAKVISDDPESPRSFDVKLSRDIEAIMMKCLEKSPANRYYTTAALLDDLTRYLDGQPVKAPRVHWRWRRLRRSLSRRQLAVAASVLALGLAVTMIWTVERFRFTDRLVVLRESHGRPPVDGPDYTVPFLLRALQDGNDDSRLFAMQALCRHRGERASSALLAIARSGDPRLCLDLAAQVREQRHPTEHQICELLLQADLPMVRAAGIDLAEQLQDTAFLPRLQQLAYDQNRVARLRALQATIDLLRPNTDKFVADYLAKAPEAGCSELLRMLARGRIRPQLAAVVAAMQREQSESVCKEASAVMRFYTDADHGDDRQAWFEWWQANAERWTVRPILVVESADDQSFLLVNDGLWRVDGEPISWQLLETVTGAPELEIVRGSQLVSGRSSLASVRAGFLFIGMMDGRPVGHHGWVGKIRAALGQP